MVDDPVPQGQTVEPGGVAEAPDDGQDELDDEDEEVEETEDD